MKTAENTKPKSTNVRNASQKQFENWLSEEMAQRFFPFGDLSAWKISKSWSTEASSHKVLTFKEWNAKLAKADLLREIPANMLHQAYRFAKWAPIDKRSEKLTTLVLYRGNKGGAASYFGELEPKPSKSKSKNGK